MKITLTKNNVEFSCVFEWIDTSFTHEFGTKHQGQYEAQSIKIVGNDSELVEFIDPDIINELEDLAYGFRNKR